MQLYNQAIDIHIIEDADAPDLDEKQLEVSEVDPDDTELDRTPDDVLDLLGFDPLEFSSRTHVVRDSI